MHDPTERHPAPNGAAPATDEGGRISVAVLIDLEWGRASGGHVKFWERIAAAAARADRGLDLVLFAEGRPRETRTLGAHARLELVPPLLSTRRLGLSGAIADHTDLAPYHPGLARRLRGFDVLHTTDAYFAHAATARAVARRGGAALVTSIHTATPDYTALYAGRILDRWLGGGALARLAVERFDLPGIFARRMRRKLAAHVARCAHVFVSARRRAPDPLPDGVTISLLRRGIDTTLFHPAKRDRAWLAQRFGIPGERNVLLFAGRIDPGKSVMTLVEAARLLIGSGADVHVVLAGEGPLMGAAAALLGTRVSLPGTVEPEELSRLYASADLFVFPSRIEEAPNVVLEAKASGLPVVVAPEGGGVFVVRDGTDGVLVDDPRPEAWAAAVAALIEDAEGRRRLGAAGRDEVSAHRPSWDEVLDEDLLPHWHAVAERVRARARGVA